MPTRVFAITADDKPVAVASGTTAEVSITVANTSGKPLRGQARLQASGNAKPEWLTLGGDAERSFAVNEAHQFVVRLAPPAGTAAGKYSFRLNTASVQNPDDEYAEGPVVSFVVADAPTPAAPPAKKSSCLFWVILAVLVLGGAVGTFLALRDAPAAAHLFEFEPETPKAGSPVTFVIVTEDPYESASWQFTPVVTSAPLQFFEIRPASPALLKALEQGTNPKFRRIAQSKERRGPPPKAPATTPPPAGGIVVREGTYTFPQPGKYRVSLTLTHDGKPVSETRELTVEASAK